MVPDGTKSDSRGLNLRRKNVRNIKCKEGKKRRIQTNSSHLAGFGDGFRSSFGLFGRLGFQCHEEIYQSV